MNDRPYKVYRIENGTVIDHIQGSKAIRVLHVLGLDTDMNNLITMGINLKSKKFGKKDVIKIENRYLSKKEFDKIAIVSPDATVNVIKDGKRSEKHIVKLPGKINGIIRCPNPDCITRKEKIESVFITQHNEDEIKYRCHYCERSFEKECVSII
ncbi:MAG: aspartate carbamoyltransferase regulatory subunit [Candidatus Muiribacterium halophilum]|uniref:Aspartate carbamoyltransferase regulatory chain n=1 Tax=Muiribacterium halophilum TaxID=2053465 RepID=A0A2N5ZBV5_MUIH1|nr:MAG: aspartate carbamoyltransferase regulatory subunit [Candidatus Muirbacterium halophilum]